MPYTLQTNHASCEAGKPHAVISDTGQLMGCHATPEAAAQQIAALVVAEKTAREPSLFVQFRQFIQKHLPRLAGEIIAPSPDAMHTGLMVAYWLDDGTAAQLALPGGEPADQLHLTLAYFGEATPLPDETLARAIVEVANFSRRQEPLLGKIGGLGIFSPDPDGRTPLVALADVPGLAEFRTKLVECLEHAGLEVSEQHDFTPHITLEYRPADTETPYPTVPALPLSISHLTISVGDKRATFPLIQAHNDYPVEMYAENDLLTLAKDGGSMRLFHEYQFMEPPDWIPYLPVPGQYTHPEYGEIVITPARNKRFVTQFNGGVYQKQVPIDAEHQTAPSGAMGWITEMRVNADGSADARVDWTDRGRTLLKDDRFKYFSPSWYDEWTDPATETTYQDVAIGGALTTRPFYKENALRPLVASEHKLKITPAAPEQIPNRRSDDPQGGPTMADELKFAELEKSFSELKTQLAGESAARQAAEAQNKTLAEQNTKLAERVTAMEKDARRKRFHELVDAPHAPWYGKPEGHLSLLETLADTFGEASEQFQAYVSQQQATAKALADSDLFREHGSNRSGGANDPLAQATQMANARAKDANIPFQDALNQVFAENPGLYEQYRQQNTVKV